MRTLRGLLPAVLALALAPAGPAAGQANPAKPRVWRPFSPDSPWNQKIPRNPEIDPRSQELVDDLSRSCKWDFLGINIKGFSIPVYYVDSPRTPACAVKCRDAVGEGFDKPVPIPEGAQPDPQSDRHLCIVDRKLGLEWGMWDARKNADGSWMCGVGAMADLKGSGVRLPQNRAPRWQLAAGARASGFPLIAGLITVDEIKAGAVEHALALAYPRCRSRYYVPPASTAQGTTKDARPDRGIPMGGRLQLDPSIDVNRLPLSPSGRAIARALQEYGAYVCDYSGAINLYADGSPDAQKEWANKLLDTYEVQKVFNPEMLRRFRLLKMPEFIDNRN